MAIRYVSTTGCACRKTDYAPELNLSLGKAITDPVGSSFFGSTPLKICNNTGTDGDVNV